MSNPLPNGDRVSVRVPKTAELVAGHIRRQIVLGQLHEGDALPPETNVYPGHMGLTTLGQERASNPFLRELTSQ